MDLIKSMMVMSVGVMIFGGMSTAHADRASLSLFDEMIIKSRAERGVDMGGRALYYAPELEYSDELSDEELGNFIIDRTSSIREVHVAPTFKGSIETDKKRLRIGNVIVINQRPMRDINVILDMPNRINARDLELGNVMFFGNDKIDNVNIHIDVGNIKTH